MSLKKFLFARIAEVVASLIAMSVIVFFLAHLTGDPLDLILGDTATTEDRAIVARHLGLDRPLHIQYVLFVSHALRGDFGESMRAKRPALELVVERLPATLELGVAAILWSVLIAVPIGVYSARQRGGAVDLFARIFAILGQAMPVFWFGLILIRLFAVQLRWLPSGGRGTLAHLVMPAFTLGWYVAAGIMRLTRSAMLEVFDSEYIKLARIKGLSEALVIWKHAFRNAMIPVLTFSVMLFVGMLGGAVVVETVFAWPGVGRLMMDAVRWRDFPVVQTVVIVLVALFLVSNLCVDVMYAYINPRIRYNKK